MILDARGVAVLAASHLVFFLIIYNKPRWCTFWSISDCEKSRRRMAAVWHPKNTSPSDGVPGVPCRGTGTSPPPTRKNAEELPCSKTVQRCWPTYRGLRSIPFLDLFRSSLYVHALELLDEMSQNSQNSQNSSNTFKDSKILFKSTFQRGEIQIEVQPDPECSNMLKWWRVPARMQK